MRTLGIALAAALMCAVLPATPSSAASDTPVPLPKSPTGLKAPVPLPKELDPPAAYVPQNACQPATLPGVAKLRDLVMRTYGVGGRGNTARSCSEGVSEHADGRAWDWMVNVRTAKEKAAAADFLSWLTKDSGANARRLGVMYVIYNAKIWAVYRQQDGWRKSSGHADHIHVSFSWNGARGLTSFWTGKVQKVDHGPCNRFAGQPSVIRNIPMSVPCYRPAALVKTSTYGRSGVLDETTRTALVSYQKAHDLPSNGTLDAPTWTSLVPSSARGDVSSGYSPSEARAYGAKTYTALSLTERSTGRPVLFLQKALNLGHDLRTGYFGKKTTAAVKAQQKKLGRAQTGTWTGADWKAFAG